MLFGQEQGGISTEIHEWVSATFGIDHRITFPMIAAQSARSLNLATAVACGVYEGLRQISLGTEGLPSAYDL